MGWYQRLRGTLGPPNAADGFDDEAAFHLEQRVEEYVVAGLSPEEARREAIRRFGGVTQTRERTREVFPAFRAKRTDLTQDLEADDRQSQHAHNPRAGDGPGGVVARPARGGRFVRRQPAEPPGRGRGVRRRRNPSLSHRAAIERLLPASLCGALRAPARPPRAHPGCSFRHSVAESAHRAQPPRHGGHAGGTRRASLRRHRGQHRRGQLLRDDGYPVEAGAPLRPTRSGAGAAGRDRQREVRGHLLRRGQPDRTPLLVRRGRDPLALVPAARAAVSDIDATLPVFDAETQAGLVEKSIEKQTAFARLSAFLAAVALLLAAIGRYGTASYGVVRRTPEIGLRMALGAQRRSVVRMVLQDAGSMVIAGILIGIPAALAAGRIARRVLEGLLFEVAPGNPWVFAATAATLPGTALLAAFLPARAAARVDPMLVLPRE